MGYTQIGKFPGEISQVPSHLAHERLVGNDAEDAHPQYNNGYRLREILYFETSSPGTTTLHDFDKVDHPGLRAVRVRVQAGGGGGGGADATSGTGVTAVGWAAQGGGYAESFILAVDLNSEETITVGAGGSGGPGSGSSGTNGIGSSFGSHVTAQGGDAGSDGSDASSSNSLAPINALGGGSGDLVIPGGSGDVGFRNVTASRSIGGRGGDSALGSGGTPQSNGSATSANPGQPGKGYGGGGSAAVNGLNQSGTAGGDGADGIVIVELYF